METILDVRDLPPPEPLERVLDALPGLKSGDVLCMLHVREPFPLYGMLRDMGFAHAVHRTSRAPFEIRIWRDDGSDSETA